MIGGQIEEVNIHINTTRFNQGVIESTIEALRRQFNDNGLSEDLLDRLKSSWEKKLKQNSARQENEARERQSKKINDHHQSMKQAEEVFKQ